MAARFVKTVSNLKMNPFKKFQYYFIGGALAKTDDAFEKVKAEVLFNFTAFFIFVNLPYLFIPSGSSIPFILAISVIFALLMVLLILRKSGNVKSATYFFLLNFFIQVTGHYIINNGRLSGQGLLFYLMFILCGYLMMGRKWGFAISLIVMICYSIGTYNWANNFALFHVPEKYGEPVETGGFLYLSLIPILLNAYLISVFVKATQKAAEQISEQKHLVEEKQKEILDSIHYAKRIQNSLLPTDKYIERILKKTNHDY